VPRGELSAVGPGFERPVPRGGYAWWYLDALSDDGAHGICIIAFIGSVFSPYYARARRRGGAAPQDHCAFNVALNGAIGRWSMTERGHAQLRSDRNSLRIGPSAVHWDGRAFEFVIAETGCPVPRPLRGRVRVLPTCLPTRQFALDARGEHLWSPLAPRARVEVCFENPALRWQGEGYLDCNRGLRALEQDFSGWTWSRAAMPGGTAVFYEIRHRRDPPRTLSLHFNEDGAVETLALPAACVLRPSLWGIPRHTRTERDADTRVLRTLVDAPFYARSLLSSRVSGHAVTAVHESLDLERFRSGWVQALLPFRMPRWTRASA
jgi:carotenoid 1,2-hydratase